MHSSSETYLAQWLSIDVCLIGGGGGVSLPWVYVVFHRYMVGRGGVGSVCHGYSIPLYVLFGIVFSTDLCSIGGRGWGLSAMGISAFYYM